MVYKLVGGFQVRKRHLAATAALSVLAFSVVPAAAHADSSTPTTYYVYGTDTAACSDAGPGTQAEPFCSLQTGVDAATTPGDTVLVTGSFYAPVTISNTGTAAAPITIQGNASSFTVGALTSSTTAAVTLTGASYVTVKDFATTVDASRIAYISGSNHVTIDGFTGGISGATTVTDLPGVEIAGDSSDVTVSRGQFGDGGRTAPSIQVDPGSSGVVVSTNAIAGGKPAIAVDGAPGTDVTSNTVMNDCGTALSLTGGSSGSSIENNVLEQVNSCGMPAFSTGLLNVDAASTKGTTVGYGVLDPAAPGFPVQMGQYPYEWSGKFYSTLAAFKAASGQGNGDLLTDPEVGAYVAYQPDSSSSPVINSANSNAPGELATDINGGPRLNDPLAPDTGVGAYDYYDRGAFQVQLSTSATVSATPVGETGVTAASQDWSKAGYTINFGDGTATIAAPYGTATHTYSKPGTYQISVSGTSWTTGAPFTDTTSFTTTAWAAGILWQAVDSENDWGGWGLPNSTPTGFSGIAQAAVTPTGGASMLCVAVTTGGTLQYDTESAQGVWQGWSTLSQPGVTVKDTSVAGMPDGSSQIIEVTSTGLLRHDVRNANGSWQTGGWGTPGGSSGIAQAAITAMPNGDSQLVAVTTGGVLEHNIRHANGSWQGWVALNQPGVRVTYASVAGMPDGSSQLVEVTSARVLKHDIRNANGSWQAGGWGTPAGSTGIAEAAITPSGDGQVDIVATTTVGVMEYNGRSAGGSWPGWLTPAQPPWAAGLTSPSIALVGGEAQVIAISAN